MSLPPSRIGPPPPSTEPLEIPSGEELDVMHRMDAIPTLTPEEKAAVVEQLKELSEKEQEEILQALKEAID